MAYRFFVAIFLIIIGSGLGLYFVIHNGFYPVAFVNFHMISAHNLDQNYNAAIRYFNNALLTYGSNPEILKESESKTEIKRAALNKLIVDWLVFGETKKRLGADLDQITEKIISQELTNPRLEEAVKEIYGLTLEDFKKHVLLAQAYREILEGRMFSEKQDFNKWLENVTQEARVIILI